jgi:hypothetical protein
MNYAETILPEFDGEMAKALVHNNLANWGGLDRLAT